MRKISLTHFNVATKQTSREINRRILLTVLRAHQPVSRADLARLMNTNRANVTLLVNQMLAERLISEGDTGDTKRGRKPTLLNINSHERIVVAVDIRPLQTFTMLTDFVGNQISPVSHFQTRRDFNESVAELIRRVKKLLSNKPPGSICEGVGVVVPGMVDIETGIVLNAPFLGWHNVNLREPLAAGLRVPVSIEHSGRACALAQIWSARSDSHPPDNLVFVSISDGVGVGIIVNGEVLRGNGNIAGQFGHIPLSLDGPLCVCGARGCWETYVSNMATVSRFLGPQLTNWTSREACEFTVEDLIASARAGDEKALSALKSTARYLGLGLGVIVNVLDPPYIYIGGEITAAWDIIESEVREALVERRMNNTAPEAIIRLVPAAEYPRLRGAAALVTAPIFAAPKIA